MRKGGEQKGDLWTLTVSEVRGVVCFESAYGKYLCVEPDGKVVADRSWDDSWEQFSLERFAPDLSPSPSPPCHSDGGEWNSSSSTAEKKPTQAHAQGDGCHNTSSTATRRQTTPASARRPSPSSPSWGADAKGSGEEVDCRDDDGFGAAGGSDGAECERDGACDGVQGRPQAVSTASSSSLASSHGTPVKAAVGGGVLTTRFALRTYHGQYLR